MATQSGTRNSTTGLVERLRAVVGARHVLTGHAATRRFRRGYRHGGGEVLAVARPGTLLQQWRCLQACVDAGTIVICQAANTGLTGGSTPDGEDYDRPIVIINTLRLDRIDLIDGGRQVVCQPGATLDRLEKRLRPHGREPHSVIGSSCIGATVMGGICNNSGGSLIRRGPAYTQFAVFARVDETGHLGLVNHLAIRLGEEPEDILDRLDRGHFPTSDIEYPEDRWASDREYADHVRDISSAVPARFNADPRRLHEASGSAGRVAVFAVRLDTFAADDCASVFYIGSEDPAELESIRRHVLARFEHLPIAAEYMHRTAYDASRDYGKDLFLFIRCFGTGAVPRAYGWKSRFDGWTEKLGLGGAVSDQLLQLAMKLLPQHLPKRLDGYRDRFAHHLLLRVGRDGCEEARRYFGSIFPSAKGDFFECTESEGQAAFLNRFVVGASIVRYRAVHHTTVEDIVALDVALPGSAMEWFETLPSHIEDKLVFKMYCGHFFCHVMHQEYLVRKGEDCCAIQQAMHALLDVRGAEYPAEHNVGHMYAAKQALRDFYRAMDPTNTFNPGIGHTSKRRHWLQSACRCEPDASVPSIEPAARSIRGRGPGMSHSLAGEDDR